MSKPSKKPAKGGRKEQRVRRRVTGRSRLSMILNNVQVWQEVIYYSDGSKEIVNQGAKAL